MTKGWKGITGCCFSGSE